MKILQVFTLRHLIYITLLANVMFSVSTPVEAAKKKVTLAIKNEILTTLNAKAPTTKAIGSTGEKVKIYPSQIALPSGKNITLPSADKSRIYTSNDRVVITTNSDDYKNPAVTLRLYDLSGRESGSKTISFGSDMQVADSGYMIVSDTSEGFGEYLYVLDKDGNEVGKIKPYKDGYEAVVTHSLSGYFVAGLVPVSKSTEKSKVVLISQANGLVEREINVQINNPKSIQSDADYFVIHDAYFDSDTNAFLSKLIVFSNTGQLVNVIPSYAYFYVLDNVNSSLVICDKDAVKSINYLTSEVLWNKRYSDIYTKKLISKPKDIPTGFNIYPLQILKLSTNNLIAIDFGQTSFNPNHPKYEAEMYLLDGGSGDVVAQHSLGSKNINLTLHDSVDGVEINSDRGFSAYKINIQ